MAEQNTLFAIFEKLLSLEQKIIQATSAPIIKRVN